MARAGDGPGESTVRAHLLLRAFTISGGAFTIVALLALGVSGGAGLQRVAPAGFSRALPSIQTPAPPAPPQAARPDRDLPKLLQMEPRTTLQGDDINDAIATYGIDDGGNLYEVHSPQTEVPSLGGPKT
jgi:hypothetical protein